MKLAPDAQSKWMGLMAKANTKTPGRILRVNAFDDSEGFANLYELLSRINHACAPNAARLSGLLSESEIERERAREGKEERERGRG